MIARTKEAIRTTLIVSAIIVGAIVSCILAPIIVLLWIFYVALQPQYPHFPDEEMSADDGPNVELISHRHHIEPICPHCGTAIRQYPNNLWICPKVNRLMQREGILSINRAVNIHAQQHSRSVQN